MSKSSISEEALGAFSDFCRISVVVLKDAKDGFMSAVGILRIGWSRPRPGYRNDSATGEFLRIGHIVRKESESGTGRLPFAKTSVFGRFGRARRSPSTVN